MPESESIHTAREVAAQLGLGAAMLRRYASTYESVSGDEITVHRRDGRLFTDEQLEVLVKARALVMRTNTDVETAIKQALEQPVTGEAITLAQSSALDTDALLKALTDAQREANTPLLDELRGIREALERLEASQPVEPKPAAQIAELNKLEAAERETAQTSKHGPVARFALWLERVLRR